MFVLAELEIFYLNKNELWKIGKFFGKEGMTPDICLLVFVHIRHVRQNFGTCS